MKRLFFGIGMFLAASYSAHGSDVKTEAAVVGDSVFIRSEFGPNRYMIRKIDIKSFGRGNQVINFAGARIVSSVGDVAFDRGYVVSQEQDDISPVKFNGTYIGANHGAFFATRVPVNQKIQVDSAWKDADGTKFRVVSTDNQSATFISEEQGEKGSWQFKLAARGSLSEVDGSQSIAIEGQSQAQVYPSVQRLYRSVSAGMFRSLGKEFRPVPKLTVSESYELLSPTPDKSAVARVTVRYTFMGSDTLVHTTVKAYQELRSFSMPGAQGGPINYQNTRLMQRVGDGAWIDITDPPEPFRSYGLQSSQKIAWSTFKFGQTIGVQRATLNGDVISLAGVVDISSSRKQYPIAVEKLTMAPGDVLKVDSYRRYWTGDEPPVAH
ncbi:MULTISPECIES: hypothetical protein [unclassified Pseudomonas]|uniref:hypothetical protein n=1 Tax=unclassified Pseudomonas TaxID=196821 RepID=UPI0020968E88|nr:MULTISPECIES: hypothetical protein [unclassified Pseudomonas]MCO7503204.1 hypothetical protein [Pseudomonas sp. VE 267-6A]MCO7532482.1 hypothetical protein [Pseudomonas sp. 2]